MLLCQLYSALFYLLNHSRAIVAHRTYKSFELIQSFVDDFCESREGDRAAELVGDESATGTVIEVADQRQTAAGVGAYPFDGVAIVADELWLGDLHMAEGSKEGS